MESSQTTSLITTTNKNSERSTTKGCVLEFSAGNAGTVRTVVRYRLGYLLDLVKKLVEENKAWSVSLMAYLLNTGPTMPANDSSYDRPAVRVDPSNRTVRWTLDGWTTETVLKFRLDSFTPTRGHWTIDNDIFEMGANDGTD